MFESILDKIEKYQTIVILRHQHPDPDAIGSQVGLKEVLLANFTEKKVLALGYDEPTLTYLAEMDSLSVLTEPFLCIICDTANRPRIDGEIWKQAAEVIKIDHHPNDDGYGDLQWVDADRSSTSEMIADFAFSAALTMTASAARLLYAGIVGDTGRFLYPSTSGKTLMIAGKLAKYDFDRAVLGREMSSFDMKIARLQGFVYENLEVSENGAARVILTREIMIRFGVTDSETSMIVGVPGNIRDVQSWAIFVEQADGHYRVRMRSKVEPINEIAKRHDGGGHALASGANAYSAAEREEIWQELQENLK